MGRVVIDLTNDTDDDVLAPTDPTIPLPASTGKTTTTAFVPRLHLTSVPLSIPLRRSRPSFVPQTNNPIPHNVLPPSPSSATSSGATEIHHDDVFNRASRNHVSLSSTPSHHGNENGDGLERAVKRMRVTVRSETSPSLLHQEMDKTHGQYGLVPPRWTDPNAQEAHGFGSAFFSKPLELPQNHDEDSLLSHGSLRSRPKQQDSRDWNALNAQPATASISKSNCKPTTKLSKLDLSVKKTTNSFTAAQDHYLIFLKEVKQFSWKQITAEFNKDFPNRTYQTLQFHYSSCLNKRDRFQDPVVLILPIRFATESAVNWQVVHFKNPGPRATSPPKPSSRHPTKEQVDDLRMDSILRRDRLHRTKRVNYTWPRRHRSTNGMGTDESDENAASVETLMDTSGSAVSVTSVEEAVFDHDAAAIVDNEPIVVDHVARNAALAIRAQKEQPLSTEKLPYLSCSQRSGAQAPSHWDWDPLHSRQWQGSLVHVDFSLNEMEAIRKAIAKLNVKPRSSRHSTQRRQLRELLRNSTPPNILQLVSDVQQSLLGRDRASITAFLHDAKAGKIADIPQIKILAAARPRRSKETSTLQMIRQREIGYNSNRGWREASKAVTYRIKNQLMDTMGPASCWTGASSDVHVVAWAPDGESFAAGAVAVDDPDSMQYNRPNNLLYGNLSKGTIRELGEHAKDRRRTESGVNSSHAMFISQDPKLYTTVSSVAFSTSGTCMYSAGYDGTICVWHTENGNGQPILGSKLNARAKIDLMTVNRHYPGVIATAAKIAESKAVRILSIDKEDPSHFTKHSFHSSKAVSRSDLRIFPTALQFEPSYGRLLLAGFGGNLQDQRLDATGDLCLWDVETLTQLQVHGSNRNVFDVEFNPNRSNMPLFAIGCVAGGNVNRGTRSLLRLYDENGLERYRCPLEIECKALDMNDISWSPHHECLIAAGCTNGRTYVWDIRWPTDPIRTLTHGRSLMPLEVGVSHEVTDTGVRFLSWGENATRLYSGSSDGIIKVWDVTRSEEDTFVKDLISFDSGIMSGAFSPDMSKLAVGEVNGSVNVLEVGKNDCSIRDAEKMRYIPYDGGEDGSEPFTSNPSSMTSGRGDSGVAEGNLWLQTGQAQVTSLSGLPMRQVVQGPNYAGPFDQSVDAPFLRQQALEFQLNMAAKSGLQCNIAACAATIKVTSEDVGDSGRSQDRIPDELRQQWKAMDAKKRLHLGKVQCTYCSRPARPSAFDLPEHSGLCERCSFACFRCGAVNPIAGTTTTFICDYCVGVWDMGSLGYECIHQPAVVGAGLQRVPTLRRFGKETYLEKIDDADTSFGDEMNALTDYYFSLAIDRPKSPSF